MRHSIRKAAPMRRKPRMRTGMRIMVMIITITRTAKTVRITTTRIMIMCTGRAAATITSDLSRRGVCRGQRQAQAGRADDRFNDGDGYADRAEGLAAHRLAV